MSNLIIITAEDAYLRFLNDIRRWETSEVPPDIFNTFWNEGTFQWMRSKLPEAEFVQKRIDDLEKMRVVTDNIQYPYIQGTNNIFDVPSVFTAMASDIPMSGNYPMYIRGLNALFMDDTLFMAHIMRSDQRGVTTWNHYRKVTYGRPYYEFINGKIRLEGRDADKLRLEYIRYPKVVSYVDGTNDIDPETTPSQNEEIVDIAVRLFTENRGDPRYKSQLQEMMIRLQGK